MQTSKNSKNSGARSMRSSSLIDARRRFGAAVIAGAMTVVLVVDPYGQSSVTAFAEDLDTRAAEFDEVVSELDVPSAEPAEAMEGSWGSWPGAGSIEEPAAVSPDEDEQVVVLTGEEGDEEFSLASFITRSDEEDPEPPSPPAPVSIELGGIDVTVAPVTEGATPSAVRLRIAGEEETSDAGVTGVLLDVSDASAVPGTDPEIELTVSYASFGGFVAGDWASRLGFVWIPDCEVATENCTPQPIDTTNDPTTQTVTAIVPVTPGEPDAEPVVFTRMSRSVPGASGGGSLAVTAGASGAQGDWSATALSPSSSWANTGSTGAFTWSLPIKVPAAAAGPSPQLGFSYSSASSDGRTPSTNNQSGVIGEGFSVSEGYVERSYTPCTIDESASSNNVDRPTGDLCWGDENATIMLNGSSQELIRDGVTGDWHPKADDGSRVERLTGSWNGGEANEYWKVTATDGTQYYFGRGKTSSGGTPLHSAWTVPVYGNDSGERCYAPDFADSGCTQVWRWNLEYVVDASGNSMTYFYGVESNRYVFDPTTNLDQESVSYVSGGHLNRIEYGTRANTEGASSAPARVVFTYGPRCITDLGDSDSFCGSSQTSTSSNHWLDTPVDLICASSVNGDCQSYRPVFFDRTRLSKVSTSTFDGTSYQPIDSWVMGQTFDAEGTGIGLEFASNVTLVLRSVTHVGHGGTLSTGDDITQPPFLFAYDFLANRVTSSTLALPLLRPRVIAIRTDSGAQFSVNYVTDCAEGDVPGVSETAQAANTRLCFPIEWAANPGGNPTVEYFHKYVVDSVVQSGAAPAAAGGGELITGSVDTVTSYEYGGGAAWAKPTGAMIDPDEVTFSDFLGFASVTTAVGVAGEQSMTRVEYFRGTDSTLTAGPVGHLVTAEDLIEYRGQVFSTTTSNESLLVSEVVSAPGEPIVVAENSQGLTATRIPTNSNYGFTYDALGMLADRTLKTRTYDENGQTVEVDDRGDAGSPADDTCTTLTYAHESNSTLAAKNLVTLVSETEVVTATCGTAASLPTDLASVVRSTYDDSGRVLTVERLDPDDGVGFVPASVILEYDVRGRPLASSDALGNVTTTAYQESAGGLLERLTATLPDLDGWGPRAAFVETTDFNPITGLVTSVTDPNGHVTTRRYDAIGRLVEVVLPQHQGLSLPSVAYEYSVKPNGLNSIVTKTLAADGESQQVSVALYDGLQRKFQTQVSSRDAGAGHDATASERGRMVSHTYYDSAGRVARQTGSWPVEGAPKAVPETPAAVPPSSTTYEYDGAGRVVAEVFWIGTDSNPANEQWRSVTLFDGATTLVIPPLGATPQTTIVDARGRVVERVEYVRDPDDDAAADTPVEVLALPHQSTTYEFDAKDQLVEMRDPEGNLWTYEYDWGGRAFRAEDPDAGLTRTTYDIADRVVTTTDANNATLAYTYDALGRQTTLRDDSVTGTIRAQWTYDESLDEEDNLVLGQLSTSTRYVAGAAYSSAIDRYDEAYRALSTTFTLPDRPEFDALDSRTFTTEYSYTADAQIESISLPAIVSEEGTKALGAETVTTRFDTASVPSWMSGGFGWGTYVAESRVMADGRVLAMDLGNTYGAYVTYAYETGTERLQEIALTRQGYASDFSVAYGYDAAGNVTSMSDQASPIAASQDNQCFGYDGLRRLEVAWTSTDGECSIAQSALTASDIGGVSPYWNEYLYDSLGNRTQQLEHPVASGGSATVATYSHGGDDYGAHQIREVTEVLGGVSTTTSFGYDAAGNRESATIGDDTTSLAWDREGELVGVDDDDYIYDANGDRIVRVDESGTTVYLPGGQELLISVDGEVSATRYYAYGGQMVAVRKSSGFGGVNSLVLDHQGSVVAAVPNTEWTATSVQVIRTQPFGGSRAGSSGVPGDRRFLGQTHDESSGLSLLGARYYDETSATFLSVDPIIDLATPAQFNAYAYGWNNPVTFSDPTGLMPAPEQGHSISRQGSSTFVPTLESLTEWLTALSKCGSGNPLTCVQHPNEYYQQLSYAAGFAYQGDGIYESAPGSWQLWWGYGEGMDILFYIFTLGSSDEAWIEFDYKDTQYRLWFWKSWYLLLGGGGEVGTYVKSDDFWGDSINHFQATSPGDTPEMSVTVLNRETGVEIASSSSEGDRPWVAAWNSREWLRAGDLKVKFEIAFPNDDMFEAIRLDPDVDRLERDFGFDFQWFPDTRTVTYAWRRRRR